MIIDMTAQFVPVFWGMVSLAALCAGAIAAGPILERLKRPRMKLNLTIHPSGLHPSDLHHPNLATSGAH